MGNTKGTMLAGCLGYPLPVKTGCEWYQFSMK